MPIKRIFNNASQLIQKFLADQPFVHAAALSFYMLLSLAPLLLIAVAIASLIFGERAARGELQEQIRTFTGDAGAQVIQSILAQASQQGGGWISTVVGLGLLLFGASTVFGQLQVALNAIWDVPEQQQGSGVWALVRSRLLAMGVVLLVGLLLLALIVASWALGYAQSYFEQWLPGASWLWSVLDLLVSLIVLALAIGVIFKILPDTYLVWRQIWLGALITCVLLGIGKYAIGLYMQFAAVGSAYGAAGSLVALLVWVYYSALILLFGAEITRLTTRTSDRMT
jgi:membrane protein